MMKISSSICISFITRHGTAPIDAFVLPPPTDMEYHHEPPLPTSTQEERSDDQPSPEDDDMRPAGKRAR